MNMTPVLNPQAHGFDARGVAKRFRHAAIFGALESLDHGETMRFINDHDPLPLLQQISQRYGHQIGISYVAREAGNIVIDFKVNAHSADAVASPPAASGVGGSCGGNGEGGCGCSGGR